MRNTNVSFDNGDLFHFATEAEARAFHRGFQYAQRALTLIAPKVSIEPSSQPTAASGSRWATFEEAQCALKGGRPPARPTSRRVDLDSIIFPE